MTRTKATISLQERELEKLRRYAEESGRTLSGSVKRALELLYQKEGWSNDQRPEGVDNPAG